MKAITKTYDPKEELWNVITHGFGLLMSITALVFLVVWSSLYMSVWHIVSFSIYGASLVVLYLASTVYHLAKKPQLKKRLNVFDHASIYVLIAGSYTPYMLVTLRGPWGWSIFGVVWGMAIAGIIFKIFFTGRFDKLSTAAYVIMGWIAVVGFYPLIMKLAVPGLIMLVVGGIFYTVGAFFYLREKISFNHVIFHVFVLLGSISHFISIFFFV